ncbi:hypothetical protein [Pseudomonas chlororaphis]|uniref:hypothetical protein n=1 Tax=Pseudomonas chlororaphis TaxID=587753 RepID=UPI0006A63ADB|nr:hypothetical protein [Pseudomonas chlororaphis]
MPKEAVEPTVSTGLEALGRGQDLDKLTQFFNGLQAIAPLMQDPDINMSNLKIRLANAIGMDTAGLLLTDADKAKRQAEQMVAQGGQAAAAGLGAGVAAQATASPENMQAAMDTAGVKAGPIAA